MLPDSWKKEIQETIEEASGRTDENRERNTNEQSILVAGAINSIGNKFDGYAEQQERGEGGKKRREILTIIGIFITAAIALGQGWVLYKQYGALHSSDAAIHGQLEAMQGQLTEMKAAYVPIKVSADAAKKSAEILFNAERARLFIGTIKLNTSGESDPQPKVEYTWINLGRGPALISEVLIDCQIVGKTIPSSPVYDAAKSMFGQSAIGPNAIGGVGASPIPLSPCTLRQPLTATNWANIGAKEQFILFGGFIRYQDAFHKYKWSFASIYRGDVKFFTASGLPPAYNDEIQEDEKN